MTRTDGRTSESALPYDYSRRRNRSPPVEEGMYLFLSLETNLSDRYLNIIGNHSEICYPAHELEKLRSSVGEEDWKEDNSYQANPDHMRPEGAEVTTNDGVPIYCHSSLSPPVRASLMISR